MTGDGGEITTAHILLGIWSEIESAGHRILATLGFNDEKAKELAKSVSWKHVILPQPFQHFYLCTTSCMQMNEDVVLSSKWGGKKIFCNIWLADPKTLTCMAFDKIFLILGASLYLGSLFHFGGLFQILKPNASQLEMLKFASLLQGILWIQILWQFLQWRIFLLIHSDLLLLFQISIRVTLLVIPK